METSNVSICFIGKHPASVMTSLGIRICDLTKVRGKKTQAKRESIKEQTGTHTYTCLFQVQPLCIVFICSEMYPEHNMNVGILLHLAVLLVNICFKKLQSRELGGFCPIVGEGSGL